ncbi:MULTISPECIES: histidinol dehydrogenase [Crateriforma]|uniref:Histidinol dehydrogenase n=1 Tax=Crateriforma conspicua TaxID=2527996 RepID=A0A5C6FUK4_9PLAN|nr:MULTISPECIES: histidinol dehydrogenase [Crateriforma]TWU65168.1 Histidinol dehydrogenase [Crateriforma conspicua]
MTPSPALSLKRVDARRESPPFLDELRDRLSPQGDVVSPRGKALTEKVFGRPLTPVEVVQTICADVQSQGIDALLRYTQALDAAELTADTVRVPDADLKQAHQNADPALIESVRRIRDNVAEFQQAILHRDVTITPRPGVTLTQRYLPLRRVGVCVPGGAAAYPSTVLMTVVPAQVAGVKEIAVVAPPTPFGAYNTDMLATCHELGVTEVYRVGGAQAVAALAYGCQSIDAVDKIVGPGNLFVALAKKHVYGTVDIDSFAGPSEVIVIADETARPDYVAADLIAQAEHSPGSALLITWDESLPDRVETELQSQLGVLDRSDLTIDSLNQFGAIILVRDADQACEMTDRFAPEHLHIETADPRSQIAKIRNSGAAFLGHHTPVALGDYAAGPSHVLPTGGTCTWAAGLCSNSFLRSGSLTEFDETALQNIAPDVVRLAEKEGLTGHARSVSIRTS